MLLTALSLFVLVSAPAQTPDRAGPDTNGAAAPRDPRDIGPLLAPLRTKHELPALVAAVVRGGEVVALGADGVRKHGDPKPVTVGDEMHLGSCTKAMTATLAARLVESNKIAWNTKVSDVFPKTEMHAAWRDVTLELLLTNRAGAPGDLDADGLWGRLWKRKGTHVEQRRELLEGVLKREPAAPPGTKFLYSNAGFAIAGHMLETLAKKPWEELMEAELFEPLGITTGGFGAPGKKGALDQPLGHAGDRPIDVGPAADNPPAIGPAGTVHMSIGDWAKFVALHLEGARGGTPFLKPETFAKLHAVPEGAENSYAMGWGIAERDWAGGRVLTHSGSNTMWFCVTWIAPEKDFAVLVCTNAGGESATKACDAACQVLIRDELEASKPAPR